MSSTLSSLPHGIGFLGGGNMAEAILAGLVAHGMPPARIHVGEPLEERCRTLHQRHRVIATPDNASVIAAVDVLVLAVKPQVLHTVLADISGLLRAHRPLLISIAAGIPVARLREWAGVDLPIVRCMPNTPALVGAGVSGLYAPAQVTPTERAQAGAIMAAVGPVHWVEDEDLIDAVTAISGSGPAYFFAFVEHLTAAGVRQGLAPALAETLARQTAWGAAQLLQQTPTPAGELRRQVTSPGGTTQAALAAFEAGGLGTLIDSAVQACRQRARELAQAEPAEDAHLRK